MQKLFIFTAILIAASAYSQSAPDNLVLVKGGTFTNPNSTNYFGKSVTISDFHIGKFEVTQKEWVEVTGTNPSQFKGDNLPVEMVTWYDCIVYCNKRSLKAGLKPCYNIARDKKDPNNQHEDDRIKWTVTLDADADGYRLPTEAEWEYAASGGQRSKKYAYSGGNELDQVAWFWQNCGDTNLTGFWNWPRIERNHGRTRPVGSKEPNELGLYDLSGNVREFCWDWYADQPSLGTDPKGSTSGALRVWKGGGWIGGDFCCAPSFRAGYEQFQQGPDQGLRVCRNK